jgi:hypothetical protein
MLGVGAANAGKATVSRTEAASFTRVRYRTTEVRGLKIFYREAGDPRKPTLLLLHGFPSSSHMFRELMPLRKTFIWWRPTTPVPASATIRRPRNSRQLSTGWPT